MKHKMMKGCDDGDFMGFSGGDRWPWWCSMNGVDDVDDRR